MYKNVYFIQMSKKEIARTLRVDLEDDSSQQLDDIKKRIKVKADSELKKHVPLINIHKNKGILKNAIVDDFKEKLHQFEKSEDVNGKNKEQKFSPVIPRWKM